MVGEYLTVSIFHCCVGGKVLYHVPCFLASAATSLTIAWGEIGVRYPGFPPELSGNASIHTALQYSHCAGFSFWAGMEAPV